MTCPHCQKPMTRLYINLITKEELWGCRTCPYRERVDAKATNNSKSKSSSKEEHSEGSG